MNEKKAFYITTTLPYVNSDPHIGFAMEIIRADTIARARGLQGYEVFFNTGTDEHGLKIYQAAEKNGIDVQTYVDHYAKKFKALKDLLNILPDVHFVRTTDSHHIKAAQEFWKRCGARGYIYKKNYQAKYCVGCELNKTDSELNTAGQCLLHPNMQIQIIDEENYFFKFSSFQKPLLEFYSRNQNFVVPDFRFNEIKSFVADGLEDFSISRLKTKMPWGVPVPGDTEHIMYVWFDALVNYISTLGWPENENQKGENFEKFWINGTPVQYAGKDNLRQQSAMWQAMLMAAGLPNSQRIVINGFITSESGAKMSKSLGNVTNPGDIVKEYSSDALRYFLLREISSFEDSPFTMERFKEAYNANLANGLGNLASRILTLSEKYLPKCPPIPEKSDFGKYFKFFDKFDIKQAADYVWNEIGELDKFIQDTEPFKVIKADEKKGKELISDAVVRLYRIARMLNPLLPETNATLKKLIRENKKPEMPLFPRKD
jgi:methionyl-tRNA synthetase